MGFKDYAKYLAKSAFSTGNKEDIQDLSKPMDRNIDLNPERQDLEWMDAVSLYCSTYGNLRLQYGWKPVKGWELDIHAVGQDKFKPCRWQVGDTIVEGRYLKVDGLHIGVVQEKVIKK